MMLLCCSNSAPTAPVGCCTAEWPRAATDWLLAADAVLCDRWQGWASPPLGPAEHSDTAALPAPAA